MISNQSFTPILDGLDPTNATNLDRLFEAGCGDATFGERNGAYIADFDRRASSLHEAVTSAIRAIEAAIPELRALHRESAG